MRCKRGDHEVVRCAAALTDAAIGRITNRPPQDVHRRVHGVHGADVKRHGFARRRQHEGGKARRQELRVPPRLLRIERAIDDVLDQHGARRQRALHGVDRDLGVRGAVRLAALADPALERLGLGVELLQPVGECVDGPASRPAQHEPRLFATHGREMVEPRALVRPELVAHDLERLAHGVQHSSLPPKDRRQRQPRRLAIRRRQPAVQRDGDVGFFREGLRGHEAELLRFGSGGQHHLQVVLGDVGGLALCRHRTRQAIGDGEQHRFARQRRRQLGMPVAERGTARGHGTLVERLGLGELTLEQIRHCKVVDDLADQRMPGAQRRLGDRERAPVERRRRRHVPQLLHDDAHVVQRARDVGISGRQRSLADPERTLEQRACAGKIALVEQHEAQVVDHARGVRAVGAAGLLDDGDGAAVEGLGAREVALHAIEARQVVQRDRDIVVIRTAHLLVDLQRTIEQRFCGPVVPCLLEHLAEVVDDLRRLGGVRSRRLLADAKRALEGRTRRGKVCVLELQDAELVEKVGDGLVAGAERGGRRIDGARVRRDCVDDASRAGLCFGQRLERVRIVAAPGARRLLPQRDQPLRNRHRAIELLLIEQLDELIFELLVFGS